MCSNIYMCLCASAHMLVCICRKIQRERQRDRDRDRETDRDQRQREMQKRGFRNLSQINSAQEKNYSLLKKKLKKKGSVNIWR